jgi:hypothetical protein
VPITNESINHKLIKYLRSLQTRFRQKDVPEEFKTEFESLIRSITTKLRQEVLDDVLMEDLLVHGKQLERNDTKLRRKPEDVTKEIIIEPLLNFLGYEHLGRSSESSGNVKILAINAINLRNQTHG